MEIGIKCNEEESELRKDENIKLKEDKENKNKNCKSFEYIESEQKRYISDGNINHLDGNLFETIEQHNQVENDRKAEEHFTKRQSDRLDEGSDIMIDKNPVDSMKTKDVKGEDIFMKDENDKLKEDTENKKENYKSCESIQSEQKSSICDEKGNHLELHTQVEIDTKVEEYVTKSESDSLEEGSDKMIHKIPTEVNSVKTNDDKEEDIFIATVIENDHETGELTEVPDENLGSDTDEVDGNIDGVTEGPMLLHLTSKRVKAPKRNKPSQRFMKENKNNAEMLIEVDEESENSNEGESQDLSSLNTQKAMSEIRPFIPPSIARPHGSVRLLPGGFSDIDAN